MLKQIQNKIAI